MNIVVYLLKTFASALKIIREFLSEKLKPYLPFLIIKSPLIMKNNQQKEPKLSRRQMVKNTTLAAAGLGVANIAATNPVEQSSNKNQTRKVALITGGARGIGRAIALSLAKEGANIVICDIADQIPSILYPMAVPADLAETKRLVELEGVKCLSMKADVRKSADLKKVVNQTIADFGRLDIVVANAGIANMGYMEQMDDDAWEDVVAVNLVGVARTLKATIPALRKQEKGRIVVIASVSGRGGSPGMSAYNASKWGVIGLTKSVAGEVGNSNITCNAVCPTAIATPMLQNEFVQKLWSPNNPTSEGLNERMKGSHLLPVGLLDPMEIALSLIHISEPTRPY